MKVAAMQASEVDPILELVNNFMDRVQRGERPTIHEYCQQCPHLADEIRELFPTLMVMDELQPVEHEVAADIAAKMPAQIGDYRIIGEIGRGGMGVVFEAEQRALGRRVALKVLPQRILNAERSLARFQREARAAARMHHTNIVPVFDVGQENEHFYYAMQLIQGQGLDSIIDELKETSSGFGALRSHPAINDSVPSGSISDPPSAAFPANSNDGSSSPDRQFHRSVARIGLQTAEALAYAHARGVIHRDIKPSNLMLDAEGVVWVTDFGLAKSNEEEATLTDTGDYLGTLRYMAPERFRGVGDARADVYSLGITLYELILQQPAFEAVDQVKTIYAINNTEPPRPRSIDSRIPIDLETIILKAIEKDRKRRYGSAKKMAQDLQHFINDEPIQARRITLLERALRWSRRNRPLAAMTAAMVFVLLATLAGASLAARHFRLLANENATLADSNANLAKDRTNERDVARAAEQKALDAERTATELADRNERDLYAAEMILAASQSRKPGGIRTVRQLMRRWIPTAPDQVDRRGPEWEYLYGLGRDQAEDLNGVRGNSVCLSSDGTLLATVDEDGGLSVRDLTSQKHVFVEPNAHKGAATHVAFSPNSSQLVTTGQDQQVRLWNATTGAAIAELSAHEAAVFCAEFSHDGKYLASGGEDGLRIWLVESRELLHRLLSSIDKTTPDANRIVAMDWHPAENKLLTMSNNDHMFVWGAEDGERQQDFDWLNTLPEMEFWFGNKDVKWSPSADRILAVGQSNAILHLPIDDVPAHATAFDSLGAQVLAAAWTPDGQRVITAGENLELVIRDAETTSVITRLRGHEGAIRDIDINGDGSQIVSVSDDGTAKTWQLPHRRRVWAEGAVAISPDSRLVALSGGSRKRVTIVELESGEIVQTIVPPRRSWIGFAAWSPDSRRLAVGFGNGTVNSLVYIWDVPHNELLHTLDVDAAYIQSIAWHPTDPSIIAVSQNSNLPMEFWDTNRGERLETRPEYETWNWNSLHWSPDGSQLAMAGWRPTIVDWKSRAIVKTLYEQNTANATGVHFSRDGKLLATASDDGRICIYDATTWDHLQTLTGHAGPVREVVWNPDATRIASLGADDTLRLWDVEFDTVSQHRQSRVVLSIDAEAGRSLNWSADGRFIALSINTRLRVLRLFH